MFTPSELRWLRSLLRHRVFRTRLCTGVKNLAWSEFKKRDIRLEVNLGTLRGGRLRGRLMFLR